MQFVSKPSWKNVPHIRKPPLLSKSRTKGCQEKILYRLAAEASSEIINPHCMTHTGLGQVIQTGDSSSDQEVLPWGEFQAQL